MHLTFIFPAREIKFSSGNCDWNQKWNCWFQGNSNEQLRIKTWKSMRQWNSLKRSRTKVKVFNQKHFRIRTNSSNKTSRIRILGQYFNGTNRRNRWNLQKVTQICKWWNEMQFCKNFFEEVLNQKRHSPDTRPGTQLTELEYHHSILETSGRWISITAFKF